MENTDHQPASTRVCFTETPGSRRDVDGLDVVVILGGSITP
jgi:hypothetical protein